MCGIVGFWQHHEPASLGRLKNMSDAIYHRGPDAEGSFLEGKLALGHRRLSILDLSEHANQPFHSPCGNYTLVYNGEIFNFQDFYPELKAKGYSFNTTSDTEVLLFLLMEYGFEVLEKLNGFFAFAFWDKGKQTLSLARDRFGVKPLFYHFGKEGFSFSSEPKGIFAGGVSKAVDPDHLDELFIYRYVSGENTIFRGIKRLLPGHQMTLSTNAEQVKTKRWFHLADAARNFGSISKPYEWFEETFNDSVRLRMIADVPVGTLLSGGLDSSGIVLSQASQGYKDLSSWNVMFKGYEHDESHIAKRFSEELGVNYNGHEFLGTEQVELTKKAIQINDEPLMHFTDNVLLGLSLKAKKKVTVLLTGEGADEVLGGYVRYKVHDGAMRYRLLDLMNLVPDRFLKQDRLKKLKRYMSLRNPDAQMIMNANEVYLSDIKKLGILSSSLMPQYRVDILEEAKALYPKNRYRQLLYLEQHSHLHSLNDKNDRTTMGASIECREPYLDYRLVTGAASLPDQYFESKGKGKLLAMNSFGKKMPDYIKEHRKIGLSMPWDQYIVDNPELRDHLENMHQSPLFEMGFLAHLDIKKAVDSFKANPRENLGWMKQLFFTSLWYKEIFENQKAQPLSQR
jgi:asparagine synthase (glutamine-hydrolysing)